MPFALIMDISHKIATMHSTILEQERLILLEVSRGDKKAFKILYDHFGPLVFKVAFYLLKNKEQSEDMVQEVFLKLWAGRENLSQVTNIENYIFIATRNTIFTFLKKQIHYSKSIPLWLKDIPVYENSPEIKMEQKEYQQVIHLSVQSLPPQQKQAYLLFEEEKMSYEQIASCMGLSRQTVKRHLALARKFIREYCAKQLYLLLTLVMIRFK